MIRGSVDVITTKRASGWIYSDEHIEPLSVEALINNEVVGRAVANLSRPDLSEAGFGDGNCGFDIRFINEIDLLYLPFVQVMLATTDLELRRWSGAGFHDFFRALYQRYPAAGRSASVFGGLWTDRTDASALVKSRTDIGILPQEAANDIARFIQDGVLILSRDISTSRSSDTPKSEDLSRTISLTLFDPAILRTLRAILDDHPVAVRADVIESGEDEFVQMSTIEELPSPAECLGIVLPAKEKAISVEVIRSGHRFPEFLPDGLSRWIYSAGQSARRPALSKDALVDRHHVPPGSGLLISPGALCRVSGDSTLAIRALVLPSRLSLLRFHQRAPRGELTHESGARIWL